VLAVVILLVVIVLLAKGHLWGAPPRRAGENGWRPRTMSTIKHYTSQANMKHR
jgi:hypothetical protein